MPLNDAERAELETYRKQDLLQRMRQISQEHWAAGWQLGLEHDLYLMAFHGLPTLYGMATIAPASIARLKQLAELTQLWWVWTEQGPGTISLAEAEQRFSKLVAEDDDGTRHWLSIADVERSYAQASPGDWAPEVAQSALRILPTWHLLRLRSNPRIVLMYQPDQAHWELRYGGTTVDFVRPAWAKSPTSDFS